MQQPFLNEGSVWHTPEHVRLERNGVVALLDPEAPNWIATDERGARILGWLDGRTPLGDIARRYATESGLEWAKGWLHVDRIVRAAGRQRFAALQPFARALYPGRARYLEPRLRELWIHANNSCNLSCEHCLVSSSPQADPGLDGARLLELVDEGVALGATSFHLTGGEPFYRRDAFDVVERVTRVHGRDLTVLTNGLLFQGAVLERLRQQDPQRLRLQVSLDGARPETNDALRGAGTFERITAAVRRLAEAGFAPTLSTVITRSNIGELVDMVRLVKELGAASWHLLWVHRKGRFAELNGAFVPPATLLTRLAEAQAEARRLGVTIDNLEAFGQRVNGMPGTRFDLAGAGVESVCVYSDGRVFPSAATVQYDALELGRWTGGNLHELLGRSELAQRLRALSVAHKPVCGTCNWRFVCGGGDLDHAWSFSLGRAPRNGHGSSNGHGSHDAHGSFDHLDPYCDLYQGLLGERLFALAEEGRARQRRDVGFDAPVIFHAMGVGNLACAPGGDADTHAPVRTTHSNCVVPRSLDTSRGLVREFYGRAAETPQAELCCPTGYDPTDTEHIPKEVLDRFYGCGGPMSMAGVAPGETVVDLGSGAGIDVFIAARKVGPTGRAIGIDMTDPMLEVAAQSRIAVAERLGYDVVDFRKGFLEEVPVEDRSVDLVTSNCVINLSPDKRRVFGEMWRVLKDHGRMVVSDIVSERALPPHLTVNAHLWGECLTGALSEEEFMAELERAGFYGLEVLRKQYWKEVEGYGFFSVTVRGYKFQKTSGCVFVGQRAVYLGPWASVIDEEGHFFPRGQAVEVCTDTAAKLARAPYAGSFAVYEPDPDSVRRTVVSCAPGSGCC